MNSHIAFPKKKSEDKTPDVFEQSELYDDNKVFYLYVQEYYHCTIIQVMHFGIALSKWLPGYLPFLMVLVQTKPGFSCDQIEHDLFLTIIFEEPIFAEFPNNCINIGFIILTSFF